MRKVLWIPPCFDLTAEVLQQRPIKKRLFGNLSNARQQSTPGRMTQNAVPAKHRLSIAKPPRKCLCLNGFFIRFIILLDGSRNVRCRTKGIRGALTRS